MVYPAGLEDDKWRDDSPDYPLCSLCGKQIGSEELEEQSDLYEPEVPIRVWRPHPQRPGQQQEQAFHTACARQVGLI